MSAEHPILFFGPMVRAILEDRKTQTRRIVKPQPEWIASSGRWCWPIPARARRPGCAMDCVTASREWHEYMPPGCSPYGQPGDLLWVRETWQQTGEGWSAPPEVHELYAKYRADGEECCVYVDRETWERFREFPEEERWRPSIFMPKWACRLRLRVEDVRVERLQEISEADYFAEGLRMPPIEQTVDGGGSKMIDVLGWWKREFAAGWDTINGKRAPWESNPWVWVVTFSRSEAANA